MIFNLLLKIHSKPWTRFRYCATCKITSQKKNARVCTRSPYFSSCLGPDYRFSIKSFTSHFLFPAHAYAHCTPRPKKCCGQIFFFVRSLVQWGQVQSSNYFKKSNEGKGRMVERLTNNKRTWIQYGKSMILISITMFTPWNFFPRFSPRHYNRLFI